MKHRNLLSTMLGGSLLLAGMAARAQVTVTGADAATNTTGTFATLSAAFTSINAASQAGNTISVLIIGNTTEPAAGATLNQSAGPWASLSIKPSGGAFTVSGAATAGSPLINLNGADNVTIDGLNTGSNALTISNTTVSATSGTSTIKFIADATNNTITNCTVSGSANMSVGTNGGDIFFSTGTTTGNDGNTISNCKIGAAGTNLPSKGIYGNGSTSSSTIENSGITITGNEVSDYFLTGGCGGIYITSGNALWAISNNKIYQSAARTFTASGTMYGIYYSNSTYSGDYAQITGNAIGYGSNGATGTLTLTGATIAGSFTGVYYSGSSSATGAANINTNTVSDISLASSSGAFTGIQNASSASSNTINMNGNIVKNIAALTTTGQIAGINWGSATTESVSNNTVNNITRNGSGTTYGIYSGASSTGETVSGNTVSNISATATGSSNEAIRGIYQNTASGTKVFQNNSIFGLSCASTGSTNVIEGIRVNYGTTDDISQNTIYNFSGTAVTISGIATGGVSGAYTAYRNNIYNLASNTTAIVSGISQAGLTLTAYDNFVSDLRAPAATSLNAVIGINGSAGTALNAFYNTIYLGNAGTLTGGATFGGAGIYIVSTSTAVIKNNIINIAGAGITGYFAALKRSTGTAGTKPANVTAGNNIYNAPYIYGEGLTLSTATNTYYVSGGTSGIADPAFNTGCGLYKTFMGETGTFNENNLTASGTTGTFAPSGTSFAESNATATTPAVTVDFAGTTRNNPADIGALEFSGSAVDATGPTVSFTDISNSYCATPPVLTATITDLSGVNVTSGTKPRLYYKLSTEANALTGNTSANNGYKYVEATNAASPFTFTPDYSLLTAAPVAGSTIQYFVVAQDNVASPNVTTVQAGYAAGFCPTGVALAGSAFPLPATPVIKSYNVNATPSLTVSAAPSSICVSGTSTLTLAGYTAEPSSSILWETSTNGGGTFTVIAGATNVAYTTPMLTSANSGVQYRASVTCGGSAIATSAAATITVNNPMVLTAAQAGAIPCGSGAATLTATGTTGSSLNWYAAGTGGTPLASGGNFTTPVLNTSTDYYVGATNISAASSLGATSPSVGSFGTSFTGSYEIFTAASAAQLYTVDVYATGAGTVIVQLLNAAGTVLQTSATATVTAAQANSTSTVAGTAITIPVNFTIPAGTGYRLNFASASTATLLRNSTGAATTYGPVNGVTITGNSNGTAGYYYNFYNWSVAGSCESARTMVTATVTTAPVIAVTPATSSVCGPTAVNLTASSANSGYTYTYNPGSLAGATQTVTPTATTTYTVSAVDAGTGCNTTGTATVTVNPAAPAITLNPTTTSVNCGGPATPLTATTSPVSGSLTVSSGTISLAIPDGSATGVSSTLAVSSIPAAATIDSVVATFSITHSFDEDIIVNLEAPNGQIINLVNGLTVTSGSSFTNTRITSDNTVAAIPATGAPFTATYRAAATTTGFQLTPSPVPTTGTFSSLFTTPNGNWKVRAYDDESIGSGTLTSCSLRIYYSTPPAITFASTAGLYTDAAGTMPYTGTATNSVYAKPSNTITYTATVMLGTCTSTATSAFTVSGSSTALVPATDANTATLGGSTDYRNASCQLIATVNPAGGSPVTGNVTSKAYVAGSTQTYNGQPYVGRSYEITPAVNAASATANVTLYFTQAELDAYNIAVGGTFPLLPTGPLDAAGVANARITQYHGVNANPYAGTPVAGQNVLITPASMSWDAANNWWAVTFPVTGFSGFVLHTTTTTTPLPIVLTAISAKATGNTNHVDWSTSVESSIGSYIVERAADGRSFNAIGTLTANNRPSEYGFADPNPVQGINYYRLHIMELSGQSSYSRIVTATQGRSAFVAMNAYPNPATDKLVVDIAGASASATLSLKDLSGRILTTQLVRNGSAVFNLATLPAGTYFAVYTGENGTQVVKVSKL